MNCGSVLSRNMRFSSVHPASYLIGNHLGYTGYAVKLTTHLHLVMRLRMRGTALVKLYVTKGYGRDRKNLQITYFLPFFFEVFYENHNFTDDI